MPSCGGYSTCDGAAPKLAYWTHPDLHSDRVSELHMECRGGQFDASAGTLVGGEDDGGARGVSACRGVRPHAEVLPASDFAGGWCAFEHVSDRFGLRASGHEEAWGVSGYFSDHGA